jgi:uncharacterized membrane protein YhiD involved in acid resistance
MHMPAVELLVRVGLATMLGFAIGIERQWRSRVAGLQTMALVSMGSALYVVLGAYTFGPETDPTRVAATPSRLDDPKPPPDRHHLRPDRDLPQARLG